MFEYRRIVHYDFYKRTEIDDKIINDRINKIYGSACHQLDAEKGAQLLTNLFKDYSHVLAYHRELLKNKIILLIPNT